MVDKERKATETAKAALQKQVTAMTEPERKSLAQYAWARINRERIRIPTRWQRETPWTGEVLGRLWKPIRIWPVDTHQSWNGEESESDDEYE